MKKFNTESHISFINLPKQNHIITKVKFVLGILLSLLIAPMSFSATPYCSNIFQNGLQTHGTDGSINFGKNSRLIHPYSTRLNTPAVTRDSTSGLKTCGKQECTAAGMPVDGLSIDIKEFWPWQDIYAPDNQTTSIGSTQATSFRQVNLGTNATAVFVQNAQHYSIDKLTLGSKSILQLPAGDYWVNQFFAQANAKIEVVGEGSVTLYVRDNFKLPLNFKINENTKDPSRISIYTFGNSEYARGSRTYAFIRSQSNAVLKNQSEITGGLLARSISLESSSIVVFDADAVDKMSFNYFCSGYIPYIDVTPPQITLLQPLETREPQFTLTGTVRDPGGIKKATLRYGNTELLLPLVNENFSIELPLSIGDNLFNITAVDDAGNSTTRDFYVLRRSIEGFEFLFDPYDIFLISDHIDITGTLNFPEGHIITSAVAQTASGEFPLQLVGNKFSVTLPIVIGYMEYTFIAFDQYGNKTMEILQTGGFEGVELVNFKITPESGENPVREITGEIRSLWPIESLVATLEGEPIELTQVADFTYRFQKTVVLTSYRERFDIEVTAPNGERAWGEYDAWYFQDQTVMYLNPEYSAMTESETIVITGSLHLTKETVGDVTGLVVTSDQIPGIEIPIDWTPDTAQDSTFSIEVPLALGENKLVVKAKKGNEDYVPEGGWSQAWVIVTRLE